MFQKNQAVLARCATALFLCILSGCADSATMEPASGDEGTTAEAVALTNRVAVANDSLVDRRTGRKFAMPADMPTLLTETQDAHRKLALLEKKFAGEARIRALRAAGTRVSSEEARAVVKRVISGRSDSGHNTQDMVAFTEVDTCTDISISIYYATEEWRNLQGEQTQAMDEFLENLSIGNLGMAVVTYAEWRNATVGIILLQVDLAILATMYDANGCWD